MLHRCGISSFIRPVQALALLLLLTSTASVAHSYDRTTGKWLWVDCFTPYGVSTYYQHFASCRGFITAIADVMQDGNVINGVKACVPERTTRNEMLNAVTAWLEQHPAKRLEPAAQSVVTALSELYACK